MTGFEPRTFWSLDDRLTTTAAHKSQKLEYEEFLSPAIAARPPAMQEQLFRQLEPEFLENLEKLRMDDGPGKTQQLVPIITR